MSHEMWYVQDTARMYFPLKHTLHSCFLGFSFGICAGYVVCIHIYRYIYILINIYIYMYRTCIMLFSLFVPNLCGWPNTLDVYYIYIYTYGICYIYISNLDTCSLFMSFQDMRFVKGAFSGALFELNYKQLQGIDNFLSISLFFGKFSYTIHVWHV